MRGPGWRLCLGLAATGTGRLQILGRNAKCLHRGNYFLNGLGKLFGLDVIGLLLEFFDLTLDINQTIHCGVLHK